ncbi:E3 ubiquitin ligase BIG BROTHER-related-like isoform X2 [Apium graveolens]|uniref:E3 ubiquitin ligase BIG BROTHER-related-like isoform X2 n=1 Tax=Apium graveolens TaxID=4045 RepID=UPI003D7B375E
MSRSIELEVENHYLTENIPAEIVENWEDFFPEHEDFSREEVLFLQESVLTSIQEDGRNRGSTSVRSHSSEKSHSEEQEGESLHDGSTDSQVALDEALARSLQDLEDDFEDFDLHEHSDTAAEGQTEVDSTENPERDVTENTPQDDVDPDSMTYEQLQSLGESVGSENNGLPEELISRLPTFKYNSRIFSKKKEECVICCMVYSSGEMLINLPCAHHYHSECIKRWLSLKKLCPVCQTEVQDDCQTEVQDE